MSLHLRPCVPVRTFTVEYVESTPSSTSCLGRPLTWTVEDIEEKESEREREKKKEKECKEGLKLEIRPG